MQLEAVPQDQAQDPAGHRELGPLGAARAEHGHRPPRQQGGDAGQGVDLADPAGHRRPAPASRSPSTDKAGASSFSRHGRPPRHHPPARLHHRRRAHRRRRRARTVKITCSDGIAHDITTGGGTLKEVVTAINGSTADTGVKATAVKVADGSYRLIAESTKTGAASSFTLTNGDGTDLLGGATVRTGTDAQISMGLGITATSSTNTFTDLVPGVSLTLGPTAAIGTDLDHHGGPGPVRHRGVRRLAWSTRSTRCSPRSTPRPPSRPTPRPPASSSATRRRAPCATSSSNTVFGDSTTSMASLRHPDRPLRQARLRRRPRSRRRTPPTRPASAAKFTTRRDPGRGRLGRARRVGREGRQRPTTGTFTTAINGHTTTVDPAAEEHRGLGRPAGAPAHAASSAVHRPRDRALHAQSQSSWLASQIASLPTYLLTQHRHPLDRPSS